MRLLGLGSMVPVVGLVSILYSIQLYLNRARVDDVLQAKSEPEHQDSSRHG